MTTAVDRRLLLIVAAGLFVLLAPFAALLFV